MSNIEITVERLNGLEPLDIIKDEAVHQRFVTIYDALWGQGSGEAAYIRESGYFNKILADKPELRNVTHFSIFTSFIDLAVCGLSLEPGLRALCYLQGRKYRVGVGKDGKDMYEPRVTLTVSGYGELVLRSKCGQIKYADNPVLVYEEDEFRFSDRDGHKSVSYTCVLPHLSNHIVAAFMRIVRNDGSIDYSVMYEEDWLRLKSYSGKNNRYWDNNSRQWVCKPNDLYESNNGRIDSGFLVAKVIKHAFKTYPKVRIGRETELETQMEDPQETDYYGVQDNGEKEQPQPQAFGDMPDFSGGVRVENNDDGSF